MKKKIALKKNVLLFLLLFNCFLLVGCASKEPAPPFTPTAIRNIPIAPTKPPEGSIYDPNSNVGLLQDFRARKTGDVITILIEEDLKGEKNVETNTDKSSEVSSGIGGVFGTGLANILSPAGSTVADPTTMLSGTSKDTFKGTGKTSRDANLKGTVSARVVDVFPDGNLMVEGTRELKINSESQYLILTGIVRPKDIKADNTISSTKLADARISYTGGGSLTEKTNPGWFSKILGTFAPF
jgi:flagellar L-ring protein precursor FlgH